MKLPDINTIKSSDEARQLAIDWQTWASEQSLSYSELAEWSDLFSVLTYRFPELTDEFKENGII